MRNPSIFFLAAAATLGSANPGFAQQPALTAEQAIQLFEEAGFTISDGRVANRCGTPSNPRVAFADLNGDGRSEAHVADVDPGCYGKPGAYFAILSQAPDQSWKRLIAEDGIVGFGQAKTGGWTDLVLDDGNSACPGVRRFDGERYGTQTPCGLFAVAAGAGAPSSVAPAGEGPLSQEWLMNLDLPTAEAQALSTAERGRLFRAAGMQQIGGGKWTGCAEDESGMSDAEIVMVQDINGDGRPEALVRDNGTFCNGMAGVRSVVMSQSQAGAWSVLYENQGFANFLVSRGRDGFPDIEAGLPGFCFPYFRWNGREYDLVARLDDKGKQCEPN